VGDSLAWATRLPHTLHCSANTICEIHENGVAICYQGKGDATELRDVGQYATRVNDAARPSNSRLRVTISPNHDRAKMLHATSNAINDIKL
jgi:hypothetical protein